MRAKTKRQAAGSPRPYKQKLLEARELRKQSGVLVYDRVALLCEVFEDRDFRIDLGQVDDLAAAKVLDAEVADLCFEFLQLRELMTTFPDRDIWQKLTLGTMWQKVLETRPAREEPIRKRRVVSQAEHKAVEEQLRQARDKAAKLKAVADRVPSLERALADSQTRIDQLESENASLRRALSESRSLVAA